MFVACKLDFPIHFRWLSPHGGIRISLVHCKPSALTTFPDFQVIFQTPWKMFQKLCLGHINSYLFCLNSRGKAEVLSISQWQDCISISGMTTHFVSLPLSSTTEKRETSLPYQHMAFSIYNKINNSFTPWLNPTLLRCHNRFSQPAKGKTYKC